MHRIYTTEDYLQEGIKEIIEAFKVEIDKIEKVEIKTTQTITFTFTRENMIQSKDTFPF